MLSVTEVVDRLSACFKCQSEGKPAADSGQKIKPANVNKVVNITISPSSPAISPSPSQHDAAVNSDYSEITVQGRKSTRNHSVSFANEVVVDQPLRPARLQLKKVTCVVNREVARPQTPLPERKNNLSLSKE
ncbi:hypothetical protein [Sodalis sp. dw_96]|uniref:hypothetical protein n=1 Tax=Sodalis sp. dw_96 TaxID=2719794 RepID=UPI001BD1BCFC|nr:hypothetical protein [Sodalis sp. dw_96]